jgi:hypothetical protein
MPPIYGKLHAVNWKERLREFSENIKEEILDHNNKEKRVIRYMPSLKEVNYELFPAYSKEEISMLFPILL